jgi:uncharacterized surface protein with fasciclin (FAS1) repeats
MKSFLSLLLILGIGFLQPGLHAQEDTMADPSLGEAVSQHDQTTTLAAALDAAGLMSALDTDGSFILMAPTDEAFAALPEGVLEALLAPENAGALTTLLQYHLVDSSDGESTTAMTAVLEEGSVTVGENVPARNGVIYLIDQVLVPADFDLMGLVE